MELRTQFKCQYTIDGMVWFETDNSPVDDSVKLGPFVMNKVVNLFNEYFKYLAFYSLDIPLVK